MKIGIIGFGSIGQRHYNNLQTHQLDVVVLSSRADVEISHQVKDWKSFVTAGPYDTIFITNETAKHLETIKKCIALKPKALFIEKPLSHSTKGVEVLVRQLKQKKISAWVGYNLQFFAPLVKVKELLQEKKIGAVYYMRVAVGQDLRGWRKRDYREGYSAQKKLGGGVVADLVHDLNYPAWLLDEPLKPVAAFVKKLSPLKIDVEDYAESVFVSKKRNVGVSVHQDYLRIPGKRSLEVVGETGTIIWDSISNVVALESPTGFVWSETLNEDRNIMYQKEIAFFLDKVKGGKWFSNLEEAITDLKNIEFIKKYAKK